MVKTKIKHRKKVSQKHTVLMVFGGVFLVAVLCFGALAGVKIIKNSKEPKVEEISDTNTAEVEERRNTPAPQQAIDENYTTPGNEAKAKTDELEKKQQQVEKNESGLRVANVVLNTPYVAGDKTIISSVLTNIVEIEGTCSYIFTKDGQSVTKITSVLPNAKNTVCEAVVLEKGSLSSGKWNVRLEYKSNLSEGISETQTFTIQ